MHELKKNKVHLRDLNFLEEFEEVYIDKRISPIVLAAYVGNLELFKLILSNETIDFNIET